MKIDDQVRKSIMQYPGLFKTRADVLEHLFYVLGNGYDWVDGELVSRFEDREWTGDNLDVIRTVDLRTQLETEYKSVRDNIDAACQDMTLTHDPYPPMDTYVGIVTMPDDIKADWAEAAEQIRTIVDPLHAHGQFAGGPHARSHQEVMEYSQNYWAQK